MPSKNPAQRLADIDAIDGFVAGLDAQDFGSDRRTVYAVIRALEIISEATRRLPDDIRQRHPEIDWSAIAAAGNVFRHEYETVDSALIWHTVKHGLGTLRDAAAEEFRRLERVP